MGRTKEVTAMSNSNKRKLEEDTDTPFDAKRKSSGITESTRKKMKMFNALSNSMISLLVASGRYLISPGRIQFTQFAQHFFMVFHIT